MRATPSEKLETIRLVEGSSLGVKRTLAELAVPGSTFYEERGVAEQLLDAKRARA